MNAKTIIRIAAAFLLLVAVASAGYFFFGRANNEKLAPALEKYEASNDSAELREALLRNCTNGNSAAMLELSEWATLHKQQFIDVTNGFAELAQKKNFGKCFADALANANAGDNFMHTFSDGNSEELNIIRADIVRAQNAKKK
jgi:hypothetical protein